MTTLHCNTQEPCSIRSLHACHSTAQPLAPLLVFVLLVLVGCDAGGSTPLGPGPAAPKENDLFGTQSRVFDGRDSVATGVDGLTATQANFTIVTASLAIRVEGGDDVGSGFVSIDELRGDPSPSTPLYESRSNEPILAPEGVHVTWGAFSGAEGAVIVKCTEQRAHVAAHLSGLIPKGVYSIWVDIFDVDTGDLLDRFALGGAKRKGKNNTLRASGRGEGHLAGFAPPGARATVDRGDLSACMLKDVEKRLHEWRVVGVYHIDGTPGVDEVKDRGTFVEQVSFAFETEEETGGDIEEPN